MTDPNIMFARAEAAFRARRFDEARTDLVRLSSQVAHPAIFHLLGLVEKERGALVAARAALSRAAALAPRDAQIANNLGTVLADSGDPRGAETAYRNAIAIDPAWSDPRLNLATTLREAGDAAGARETLLALLDRTPNVARAWSALGALDREAGDLAPAAEAFDRALALAPDLPRALHGRARVALERGGAKAPLYYAKAAAALPEDGDVAIGEAEAFELVGDIRATDRLARMVDRRPEWVEGQRVLARIRWEQGEAATFLRSVELALAASPADPDLWNLSIELLAGVDRFTAAADAARQAQRHLGALPGLVLAEAVQAGEAGDNDRAGRLLATLEHEDSPTLLAQARHAVRMGEPDRAAAMLDQLIARDPGDISAWALQGVAWRMTGDDRAHWLHGQANLIGARDIELAPDSLAILADLLRDVHRTRAHPIGQSLRGGTQTRGRLFARAEPELASLRVALDDAVGAHWDALPPYDERHPLLRHRRAQPGLAGSWSVRLTQGGLHVAHTHPQGLLSSACYLVVPATDGADRPGWLELGRPPATLGTGLAPLAEIRPTPGRLALFPSTLHHGTRPFDRGERLTVAFDVTV